jgi:mono/diheme cytochrome c family protein
MRLCLVLALLAPLAARADDTAAGKTAFDTRCVACHGAGGVGTPGLAPALAGSLKAAIAQPDGPGYVQQVLLQGLSGRIVSQGQTFMGAMPSQAAVDDAELAAIANYLARDLNGAAANAFSADGFRAARDSKPSHKALRDLRARLLP